MTDGEGNVPQQTGRVLGPQGEGGLPQPREALHEPGPQIRLVGIDDERHREVVGVGHGSADEPGADGGDAHAVAPGSLDHLSLQRAALEVHTPRPHRLVPAGEGVHRREDFRGDRERDAQPDPGGNGGDGAGDFPLRRVDITAGGLRLRAAPVRLDLAGREVPTWGYGTVPGPEIRLRAGVDWYDFSAKYLDDAVDFDVPADLVVDYVRDKTAEKAAKAAARQESR